MKHDFKPMAAALMLSAAWAAGCMAAPTASPPVVTEQAVPTALQPQLSAMLDDAARRSGVPAAQLRVVSAEVVTWSDGALGCPQPDRAYTQALVPGWRVVIEAAGASPLHYHADRRGGWVWCPASRALAPGVPELRR